MRDRRRFSDALRSASQALSVAADSAREDFQRRWDQFEDSHDECCERRRKRPNCCAVCSRCGLHLEDQCCCDTERTCRCAHEDRDSPEAEWAESTCRETLSSPLPPYPPYPPAPAHPPMPPYPPFPPYPPYIVIASGSGCGCQGHPAVSAGTMPAYSYPHAPQPPSASSTAGAPNTTVARPATDATGVPPRTVMSNTVPSFPDPASISDFDALLDLGERAAATVRELVPMDTNP